MRNQRCYFGFYYSEKSLFFSRHLSVDDLTVWFFSVLKCQDQMVLTYIS